MSETRHQFLKRTIRQRVDEMLPGSRLSTENEFSTEFQVSRMTVNKVICELEKEGLVIRIRHHGTFIREHSKPTRMVTFLLPCPDNLVGQDHSSFYRRELLSGAMEAVRITGSRLETLSVSPTNNMDDVDFSSLKHLKSDSLVIVSGTWYAKIFAILHQYSCRVCFLDEQVLYSYTEVKKYTENWLIGDMDMKQAIHDLVLRLYQQGCRRIAILSPYLQYPGHARTEGYRTAIQTSGLPELLFIQDHPVRGPLSFQEIDFLPRNHCDGVIIDTSDLIGMAGNTLNQTLGLPDAMRLGAIYFHPEVNFFNQEPLSFQFDYKKMGYEAIMRLLSDETEPRYKIYPAIFNQEG